MSLKPLEVKTSNIATYAVTESRIAKNAVTGDKIVDGAVTEAKLKANSVTTAKLKDKQVTGAKIADATITQDKLVLPIVVPSPITRPISPPVETAEIKDGAITRAKLSVAAVETDNIKDLNVTNGKLASSAVTTPKIADSAVTPSKLAIDAVETAKLKTGAVTPDKLSAIAPPTDGQFPSYNQAQSKFEWQAPTGGGSVITFIVPVCVVDDTNTIDRFLNVDVSTYVPDGARGVLALLKAVNTSGTPMAQGQNASILNADSQICLTCHLTPGAGLNWVDGCAGMVPLAVLTPTRELKYTIERNGVQSRVEIDITGYVT